MIRRCFAVVLLLFLCSTYCFAAGESVVDQADLLSAQEEADLRKEIATLEEQYDLTFVLLTIDDYEPYDTLGAYADDYYDTHGYPEDGLLFVVAIGAREYYTSTAGLAITRFSDSRIRALNRAAESALREGRYGQAFTRYLAEAEELLAEPSGSAAGAWPVPGGYETVRSGPSPWLLVGSIILSLIVGTSVALWLRARMKTARQAFSAEGYIQPGSFVLSRSREVFLYKNVTRVAVQSTGSGGTSVHRAPSGRMHGGGGGRF